MPMLPSCPDKTEYTARIEALKQENLAGLPAPASRAGRRTFLYLLRQGRFSEALRKAGLRGLQPDASPAGAAAPDYFSDERIAVYTVITGPYDELREPACCPDNCDFFLISDCIRPPEGSVWKQPELPPAVREALSGLDAVSRNRFLKMMPHRLFPAYRYSVYLDGNISPVTDPTEFVNRMPAGGIMLHRHVSRDCVYEEIRAVLAQKKAPRRAMKELRRFLRKEGMPAHYGLLECPVIVRRHCQPECRELMEAWWALFERFPYRDQLLLPYLLYRRGIRPDGLTGLGNNVRRSPCFRRYPHASL